MAPVSSPFFHSHADVTNSRSYVAGTDDGLALFVADDGLANCRSYDSGTDDVAHSDAVDLAEHFSHDGQPHCRADRLAELKPLGVRATRIARGISVGGELEYAGQGTIALALQHREEL